MEATGIIPNNAFKITPSFGEGLRMFSHNLNGVAAYQKFDVIFCFIINYSCTYFNKVLKFL